MITLPKTAVLGLFLLASNTQVTQCFTPEGFPQFWQISFWFRETTKEDLIQQHLEDLENDLIGYPHERVMLVIPLRDVKNIKKMGKRELKHLTYQELQNKDRVHLALGSVMKQYVTDEASSIARNSTDNGDKVNATANAIGNSFGTRLENTPHRNGQALQEFFGTRLVQKVQDSIANPTYTDYYNPHNQLRSTHR